LHLMVDGSWMVRMFLFLFSFCFATRCFLSHQPSFNFSCLESKFYLLGFAWL
jgi:hypothetical protein